MTDQVILSASRSNLHACVDLASTYGLGIEVMEFAYPDVLDGDWQSLVKEYQRILAPVNGLITIHGPFMDMVSGSPDALINEVCRQRYLQGIEIAAELGAKTMVVHANFIGALHNTFYRHGWHMRNIEFWHSMMHFAESAGVTIALENMWEFDPSIISDLLEAVNHPNLGACIDIGHAHLFSDAQYTLLDWFNTLQPWLVHSHMNNNNGILDEHHGFDYEEGVLNYQEVLRMFRALPSPPPIVLEMDEVDDMRASLRYLNIDGVECLP